jgi:hypothetical protein
MKAKRKSARPTKRDGLAAQLAYHRDAIAEALKLAPYLSRRQILLVWAAPSPQLCEAAKFFDLDLKNETERSALLGILAGVVFNKPKKGRPQHNKGKWDVLTLIQLAVDCNNVKTDKHGISDKKAAAEIKRRHPARYKHNSAEMIRQNLRLARMWLEDENRNRADRGIAPITLELVRPVITVE